MTTSKPPAFAPFGSYGAQASAGHTLGGRKSEADRIAGLRRRLAPAEALAKAGLTPSKADWATAQPVPGSPLPDPAEQMPEAVDDERRPVTSRKWSAIREKPSSSSRSPTPSATSACPIASLDRACAAAMASRTSAASAWRSSPSIPPVSASGARSARSSASPLSMRTSYELAGTGYGPEWTDFVRAHHPRPGVRRGASLRPHATVTRLDGPCPPGTPRVAGGSRLDCDDARTLTAAAPAPRPRIAESAGRDPSAPPPPERR
jgi:hypothetical protein